MQAITNTTNFNPMFKVEGKKYNYRDAPVNELMLVVDIFSQDNKEELDILGGQLLAGSVIVKLNKQYADRLSWTQNQSLTKEESLVYVDVGFAARLDDVSNMFDLTRVHKKTLTTNSDDIVGKVVLLKDLVYCGRVFAKGAEFSFKTLGIV